MRFLLKKTARQITNPNLLTVHKLTAVSEGTGGAKGDDPRVEVVTPAPLTLTQLKYKEVERVIGGSAGGKADDPRVEQQSAPSFPPTLKKESQ